jgi:hypothetical protein
MIFFWFIIPFLVLMVLSGTRRHQREEENEDEGGLQDEGGFEEDEESNEGGKASLTPLWKYVTKVDVGRGGGTIKFLCPHVGSRKSLLDCLQEQSPTPISLMSQFVLKGDQMEENSERYRLNSETRPGMHGRVRS